MGQAASDHVRERFSIQRIGREMLTLYDQVIRERAQHSTKAVA
jgi:hypothetical protein